MPSYEEDLETFEGLNTQVLGISVDHVPCLKAWAESIGGIRYPLLSDFWPHGMTALKYGVLRAEGMSERALFVVDMQGVVRYVDIHDFDKQPDNEEVFKVLRLLNVDSTAGDYAQQTKPPEPTASPGRESASVVAQPATPSRGASAVAAGGASAAARRVVMYCRPGCIDCRLARRFLEQSGVEYSEVNVMASPGAEARVRAWTGGPLISPVFDIDGTIVIDFKRAELARALGLA